MCGIAGFYSSKYLFEQDEIKQMAKAIAHRGPNAEGYFVDNSIALAHKRLSIIDLSENANQPMYTQNKELVMVFNGEIYNFKELANQLSVNTKSDTEVLLKAFEKWGVEFVHHLNGMFAIAIYNCKNKKLYLFRDRMGIKPLFYYYKNGQLAFASELKALLKLKYLQKNKTIDNKFVSTFLKVGYIPEPYTIYENIYKFPKGNYAVFEHEKLTITPYWQLHKQIKSTVISNENEAKQQLKELLQDAVKYRLVSDVPYGTFLSGGIDSSLVSAMAQSVNNQQIKTFSIGFAENKFNETNYARKVAEHIQSNHFEYILTQKDAINILPDMFEYYDEPFADTSAIPTMLVSKMAKQQVSMTLSGDGGDELFHGYGAYKWAERLSKPILKNNRKIIASILKHGSSKYKRIAHLFNFDDAENINQHIFSQEQYFFSNKELNRLLKNKFADKYNLGINNNLQNRKLTAAEQQAMFDLNYYLPDDLLVKIDRATMRYALETRVPILDHRVVEFAINLHPNLKNKNNESKYLLKQVLYDFVPKELFARPKWGFSIPLEKWLKNELRFLIDDYLSEKIVNDAQFVNYNELEKIKKQFLQGSNHYLYNRIWLLICLHKWYITTFKNNE